MDIIYYDDNIIVAIKPAGVISTDEPGGMPSLLRQALGNENADIRTVHRLDQVVSGLMVFAQNPETASELSRQIRAGDFKKTYLAVVRGVPQERKGRMEDILLRSKEQRKTFVVNKPCRGSQEAVLDYRLLGSNGELSMVEINLVTGRTHQIRAPVYPPPPPPSSATESTAAGTTAAISPCGHTASDLPIRPPADL